jgi:hypothetical protein
MSQKPAEVYSDPQVIASTHAALFQHRESLSMAQPTTQQLLAALTPAESNQRI